MMNGRSDDQHGNNRCAHNDHQAAKGFPAPHLRGAFIGSHQVCEYLDTGHHRQYAGEAAKSEMEIFTRESFQGEGRQTEAKSIDGREDHHPEQD